MANNLWSATTTDVGQNGDIALECTKTYNGTNVISGQDIGFADGQDASTIVELYVSGPTDGGLHAYVNGSTSEYLRDPEITFDYMDMEQSNLLSTYTSGGRVVYSLHNVNSGELELHIGTAGGNDSGTTFKYSATYGAQTNSWLSHEDWDGNMYYTFTGYDHTLWEYAILPVTKNKKYTFYLHTYSEASYDGIIISSQQITSPKSPYQVSVGSGGVLAKCSGVDATYTSSVYRPSSDGNVYIYYRTNSSNLAGLGSKEIVEFDTNNTPSITTVGNPYTTGDIKVIVETVPQSTITLNDNGGSGGDGSIQVDTGSTLSSLQVNLPSRRNSSSYPYFEFLGYYTSVSYTGGTVRIGSTGNLSSSVTINSNVSWYARWSNTISYSPSTSKTIDYSTSSQNVSLTSTAGKCSSGGTVTYTITSILKDGSTQSITGWSISSDGKTLTVPASQGAGSYVVYVKATSPNSTSTTSNTFAGATLNKTINLTISAPATITITLNQNGGSGGTTSVTVAPGASSWSIPTQPTRTGFTFMGYYDAATSGIQYTNASGSSVRAAPSSNKTLYANWLNKISLGNSYSSQIEVYCSDSSIDPLTELNKTVGTRNISWSAAAPTCPAGTVSANEAGEGWDMSSGGQYIVLGPNWDAGVYYLEITLSSPSGSNYRGDTYTADNIEFTILPVTRYPNNTNPTKYKNTSGTTGTNVTYGTPTISIGNGLTAGGGSATVSCSVPNTTTTWYWKYTNGTYSSQQSSSTAGTVSWSITTQTFTPSGSSNASNITRFSKSSNTLSHTTMGTNAGTDYVKVTAVNGGDSSKTATDTKSISNTSSTSTSTTYGTPTVEIGSGLTAAGGSAVITCSVSNTQTTTTSYTSGSSTSSDSTVAGTAVWRITSNGNSRFSHPTTGGTNISGIGTVYSSGNTVSHSNMGANEVTDTVTVTAYNYDSTSKTATASKSITNPKSWQNPSFSTPTNNSHVSLAAAGETFTIVASATQKQTYASGTVAQTVTLSNSDFTYTVATSKDGFSLSSNQVTVTNNTSTSERNGFRVKITASKNSKTATRYQYYDQPAGSQGNLAPVITGYSYGTAGATGVTNSAPTVTYQQEQNAWNGVAGTGTVVSTGGTLAYTTTGTLPSGFSTGTNFATTGNITWANNTSTSTKDAKSNLKVTVTIGGLTSSAYTCTACSQSAGAKVYSTVTVDTYTYSTSVAASGTTNLSPTIVCKATYTWNGTGSSTTETVTPSSLAFTRATTYSWATAGTSFSSTGKVTIQSLGTTISNARNFYSAFSVVATYSGVSSASKTATTGKQNANYVTAITPKSSSNTDGAHFSYANIGAGETSASPSLSGGALYTFSSGDTKFDSSSSPSFGGTASYSRVYSLGTVQNGFTAVNSSTGVLTATSYGTTVGNARTSGTVTSVLTVTYTHASTYSAGGTVTSSTKTSTATCTQGANALVSISLTVGATSIVYGNSTTGTVTATYTSGATQEVTSGSTFTTNPTGILQIS